MLHSPTTTTPCQVGKNSVNLELRPRFPLFGGWKTFYTVGYNVPTYEVLSRSGSDFKLSVRFVDHLYDHMAVEKETLRVVLPEGAEDIQVKAPFALDSESRDVSASLFLLFSGVDKIVINMILFVFRLFRLLSPTWTPTAALSLFSRSPTLLRSTCR